MIDTVKLRSPALSNEQAALIERQLVQRIATDLKTGERIYELTSDTLAGSFDNRIQVRLMREEWLTETLTRPVGSSARVTDRRLNVTRMVPCAPYVSVEGSVHKAMVGHNITGGPQSFQAASCWFVDKIAELLHVSLPHGSLWGVERVDVTECFNLYQPPPYVRDETDQAWQLRDDLARQKAFEAVEEFIGSLNRVEYPRRKRRSYGLESLQFGGVTTGFSLYHKGPEFAKHDGRLLRDSLGAGSLSVLQELANGIMRVEISVKARKLRADVESGLLGVKGEKPTVVQVTDAYLQRVHDQEVARVIREGHKDMTTVRLEKEVSARLFDKYKPQLAGSLYGLWVRLSSHGEKEVRKTMKARTFYLQRKQLINAGCSWAGTDIVIRHSAIPYGFSLRRSDPSRDTLEDPRISELLRPYRAAA